MQVGRRSGGEAEVETPMESEAVSPVELEDAMSDPNRMAVPRRSWRHDDR